MRGPENETGSDTLDTAGLKNSESNDESASGGVIDYF
jgi:hypothetical protein